MSMLIAVPTRGRQNIPNFVLRYLPPEIRKDVVLFVAPGEMYLYQVAMEKRGYPCIVREAPAGGIAIKRLHIGQMAQEWGYDKFLMLDDDINFLVRLNSQVWNMRPAEFHEVQQMLDAIELQLDLPQTPMVGVSGREGNNRISPGSAPIAKWNTRAMRVLGFRTREFLACQHARVQVMEDFDITLQLLAKGFSNVVFYYWANGQRGTQAVGGCSVWRTLEIHEESARRLAELHPQFVTTRMKKNKTGDLGERLEVTIQWKRAAEEGVRRVGSRG